MTKLNEEQIDFLAKPFDCLHESFSPRIYNAFEAVSWKSRDFGLTTCFNVICTGQLLSFDKDTLINNARKRDGLLTMKFERSLGRAEAFLEERGLAFGQLAAHKDTLTRKLGAELYAHSTAFYKEHNNVPGYGLSSSAMNELETGRDQIIKATLSKLEI